MARKLEDCKHGTILIEASRIESGPDDADNSRQAWRISDLAQQVESVVLEQQARGTTPDAEDLATLYTLDAIARNLEGRHAANGHPPIDGGEGTLPSAITRRILAAAMRRLIP